MKYLPPPISRAVLAGSLSFGLALNLDASIKGPYAPDENTVILLHLDEPSTTGIAANSVPDGMNFTATSHPNSTTPRDPMEGILGGIGASGTGYDFGSSASLTGGNSFGLFIDANANGIADLDGGALGGDAVAMSSLSGPNGEFTYEALVNLPAITGSNREIISMDSSASPRPFQFRITSGGVLEFNNIGTAGGLLTHPIPTTGPESFVPNQWFHVAMTYDGFGTANFYWTRIDPTRTGATLLASFPGAAVFNQTGSAVLTIGNENRNTAGEGLLGLVDEVRISNVVRSETDMIFSSEVEEIAPTIDPEPVAQFLGVGETLFIQAHASGSPVLTYRWQKSNGGEFTDLPGETSDALTMPVTFDVAGDYRFIVQNSFGSATSAVARVAVGGLIKGLWPTGFDDTGALLPAGSIDPHYTLWASADPFNLGPLTYVLNSVADYNANDQGSQWIGPAPDFGGVRGNYTYRTTFVLDTVNPDEASISGSVLSAGPLSILLNGEPTGIVNDAPPFPGPHRILFNFTIDDGFVAGVNTLDFAVDNTAGAANAQPGSALRVTELRGIGAALAAGEPVIVDQPESATIREGGKVTFTAVGTGRPPLSYQWYGDDTPIPGATGPIYHLDYVASGGQPSRFKVVVSNDSGSTTSAEATLAVSPENGPIVASNLNLTGAPGVPLTVPYSLLLQNARDPDGDPISIALVDATGTNTDSPATISVIDANIIYENAPGFTGEDSFNVVLSDGWGGDAIVAVNVSIMASDVSLAVARAGGNNIRITWPAAATTGGMALYSSASVQGDYTTPVDATVTTTGDQSSVEIPATEDALFIILRNP